MPGASDLADMSTIEDKDVAHYESIRDKMVITRESFGIPSNRHSNNNSTSWGVLERKTSDQNYEKMTSLTKSKSENMINAVKAARNGNFHSVITLSGFSENNPLNKLGDINLWVDNKSYNFVENVHQIWLLAIVDLVIGKREYSA